MEFHSHSMASVTNGGVREGVSLVWHLASDVWHLTSGIQKHSVPVIQRWLPIPYHWYIFKVRTSASVQFFFSC